MSRCLDMAKLPIDRLLLIPYLLLLLRSKLLYSPLKFPSGLRLLGGGVLRQGARVVSSWRAWHREEGGEAAVFSCVELA